MQQFVQLVLDRHLLALKLFDVVVAAGFEASLDQLNLMAEGVVPVEQAKKVAIAGFQLADQSRYSGNILASVTKRGGGRWRVAPDP